VPALTKYHSRRGIVGERQPGSEAPQRACNRVGQHSGFRPLALPPWRAVSQLLSWLRCFILNCSYLEIESGAQDLIIVFRGGGGDFRLNIRQLSLA
jgi:hypothetical protein